MKLGAWAIGSALVSGISLAKIAYDTIINWQPSNLFQLVFETYTDWLKILFFPVDLLFDLSVNQKHSIAIFLVMTMGINRLEGQRTNLGWIASSIRWAAAGLIFGFIGGSIIDYYANQGKGDTAFYWITGYVLFGCIGVKQANIVDQSISQLEVLKVMLGGFAAAFFTFLIDTGLQLL